MTTGGPADWDAQAERRGGNGRRWTDELRDHERDVFAHSALIDRLLLAAAPLRANIETRLQRLEQRMAVLMVVGAVALVLLGAIAGAIATHAIR